MVVFRRGMFYAQRNTKKEDYKVLFLLFLLWCRGRDLNPHEGSTSSVFETDASAYSATPALFGKAGGVDGIRTHGFYLAKVTLSQLSYDPNNSDVLYHKGFKGSSTKYK